MLIVPLLTSLALAAPPEAAHDFKSVQIEYKVTMDLDKMADMGCKVSGICDCEATYFGTAKALPAKGNTLTFAGSWDVKDSTCAEGLTLWVPEDKKAHHTIRLDPKGQVHEWVAHADPANSTPLTEGIKDGKQVFLNEMAIHIAPGKPLTHEVTESKTEQNVGLTTTHAFTITLK